MKMGFLNKLLLLVLGAVAVNGVTGQIIMGEAAEVDYGCGLFFRDDGNTAVYTGANIEMTICPDTPGDFVSVFFVAFTLFDSPLPNQDDVLAIFDGNSTAEASLGTYTGTELQGLTVWCTPTNDTGCLTFVFSSPTNGANALAGWEGQITCGTPCAPPTAAATFVAAPEDILEINNTPTLQICTGESVTVQDNGSSIDGFTLEQWLWDFDEGDAELVFDGNAITHTYDEPGAYTISLSVGYDNGTDLCTSTNLDPLQVFVSTPPVFNTVIQSPICAGTATVDLALDGSPVISELWTDAPDFDAPSISPTGFDAGNTYCSQLEFDVFPADAVLENCEDLISVVASMEHSYLGDLDINVTCPDGTSVVLQTQGGGGTFLGEAVDVENDLTEGVCYDYGWSETSTLGQIEDPANSSNVTYVDALGNNETANIVNPGIYEPENTLCELEGCPLNGTWEFCFTDLLGADNGFVCTWNLNLNPTLLPGVTIIQPEIVFAEWDVSPYVDGSELVIVPSTTVDFGLDVEAVTPGVYPLQFFVENDFGCAADTLVNLEVIDNPGEIITAGPDQVFCSTPVMLEGGLDLGAPSSCGGVSGNHSYCYGSFDSEVFSYCPDTPGDGTLMSISFTSGIIENFIGDVITIYDGPNATGPILGTINGDVTGNAFTATNPDGCISMQFTSDGFCDCQDGAFCDVTGPVSWCVSCGGASNVCDYDWSWSPAENLDNPLSPQPNVLDFDGTPTEYTLSVEPVGFDNCAAETTVMVVPGFEYAVDSEQPSCLENDGYVEVEIFEDATAPEGPFTIELFQETPLGQTLISELTWDNISDFVQNDLTPGGYSLQVSDSEGCEYLFPLLMEAPEPLVLEALGDTTICLGGSAQISARSDDDLLNEWTYTWEDLASDTPVPNGSSPIVSPIVDGEYVVNAVDPQNCPAVPDTVEVQVRGPLVASLSAAPELCPGEEAYLDGSASDGGWSEEGLTYTWTFEGSIINGNEEAIWTTPVSSGEFCITVGDNCETPLSTACAEIDLETPLPASFFADTTRACGQGTFLFKIDSLTDLSAVSSVVWSFGDNTYANGFEAIKTFDAPGFYDVAMTVTSQSGCDNDSVADGYIWVLPLPEVEFIANPWVTRVPDTEVSFAGSSPAAISLWQWTFNYPDPLGVSFDQNPVFSFPMNVGGTYPVSLEVTDFNGCENIVRANVVVHDLFNLFIPNSFTPNNDGYNDAFLVEGTDIDPSRFRMEVFNRWGEMIWSTTDPTDAWYAQVGDDGQHYVQSGTYSYRIEVNSLSEEDVRKEVFGHVNVIR